MLSLQYSLFLTVLAIVAWIWPKWQRGMQGPLRKVPGPRLNRFSYLPLKYHAMRGREVVRISPTEVIICNLEAAREIHKIGTNFYKARWYRDMTMAEEPTFFSITDPKDHAARRRLFSRAFSQNSLNDWEPLLQAKTDLAITKIQQQAMGGTANILQWFSFLATDLIAELSFGESLGSLELGRKTEFSQDLASALKNAGLRYEVAPVAMLLKILPLPSVQYWQQSRERIQSFGKAVIQRTKDRMARGETRGTFFSKMLAEAEAGETLTEKQVQWEASNLIVAGSDTTAITLTYLVWIVLKRPDVKAKILKEIESLPDAFTNEDVQRLPYLDTVVRESLRLYGAAPASLPRTVPDGGAHLAGYYLPGGITVSTQAFTLHRNPDIFTDPYEFLPDRWNNPTPRMKEAFMPYSIGSRACLGMHLARMELNLATAKFFRRCPTATLAPSMTDGDMEFENFFLIAPKNHKCDITIPL
ncbi:hypothetical protein CLAIMM_03254 isoform 1 [Cladophialophora immunda]|nr:hypothetical protein CLAIMM_03254 isoform 1 [Cladophialophora immunda]